MNDLVKKYDGQPTTTSLIIAKGTESQHASVIRLVRDNLQDFEEFGRVGFEIAPFKTAGGKQERTVAVLNREHAMLLMTYMRNTAIVRDFKKNLIRAFVEMEKQIQSVDMSELDEAKLIHRAIQASYQKIQRLEAENLAMIPKAAYVDTYVADEDLIKFRTVANQLGIGEQALRELLISKKWIYRETGKRWSNKKNGIVAVNQYRAYADKKHLFRLVPWHESPRVNGEVQQALKLTPMGAERVAAAVKRWGFVQSEIQISSEGDSNVA